MLEFARGAAAMFELSNESSPDLPNIRTGQPCAIAQLCCQFDRAEHSLATSRTIAGDGNGAASHACLIAAEIAVIFQPLMAGSDPPLVRRCFPERGQQGAHVCGARAVRWRGLSVPRYSMSLFKRIDFATLLAELERWSCLARPNQLPPPGEDWFIWLLPGMFWSKARAASSPVRRRGIGRVTSRASGG